MRKFNKIFGIGISRTGTTSLTMALRELGISAIHLPKTMAAFWLHQAATDTTVACRFRELDQIFPGSLFIYTEREPISWLKSVEAHHFKDSDELKLPPDKAQFVLEARIRIYGTIKPARRHFVAGYARHLEEVARYFAKRRSCLLKLNIIGGQGWDELSEFLDVAPPTVPFPHLNRRRAKGPVLLGPK